VGRQEDPHRGLVTKASEGTRPAVAPEAADYAGPGDGRAGSLSRPKPPAR
jgi:hypothetical protein